MARKKNTLKETYRIHFGSSRRSIKHWSPMWWLSCKWIFGDALLSDPYLRSIFAPFVCVFCPFVCYSVSFVFYRSVLSTRPSFCYFFSAQLFRVFRQRICLLAECVFSRVSAAASIFDVVFAHQTNRKRCGSMDRPWFGNRCMQWMLVGFRLLWKAVRAVRIGRFVWFSISFGVRCVRFVCARLDRFANHLLFTKYECVCVCVQLFVVVIYFALVKYKTVISLLYASSRAMRSISNWIFSSLSLCCGRSMATPMFY